MTDWSQGGGEIGSVTAMRDENEVRRRSAMALAEIWREHGAVAAMHVGSAAVGAADPLSDVDMSLYYEPSLPDEAVLAGVRGRVGGSERLYWVDDVQGGACVESFMIDGIRHDFAHMTVARWEADMDVVLVRHQADSPLQKAISGMLEGIPLLGADRIETWTRRAQPYPEGLRLAMVRQHLRFHPVWVAAEMAEGRGDHVWFREIMFDASRNVLGVLMGLNRIYHWGEYKHQAALFARLTIAPRDLSDRLSCMLSGSPSTAAEAMQALVDETLQLAQQHLPESDADRARRRFNRPVGTWQ